MKQVEVTIKGISPLLMHRFPLEPIEGLAKKSREEQAEISAYRMESKNGKPGNLHVPGLNFQRALVSAATFSKGKGRASLQKIVAACVFVTPEYLDLGTATYEIDSRRVVIPATHGAVIAHRPKLSEWTLSMVISYDDILLTWKQLREVVDTTGSRVGILDFRPEKKGPFGRFMVTSWV